jgi:hypothetical protein
VWGIKITALEESANFVTLDTEKLFSKLKPHQLSHKGHPNHDASISSKALITSARVGDHDPPTPSHLLWSLLCLRLLQLPMSNMRPFPMTRLPCLQGNFRCCTSSTRRGEETPKTLGVSSSVATPPTLLPTALRGRSMTTPTRTTTTTTMTKRRRITSRIRRRRPSRRSCPEHV